MNYFEYTFAVNPPQPGSEILMAIIADMGFETFDSNEQGFAAYINEEYNSTLNFDDLVFDDFTFSYTVKKIEQKNWNQQWEEGFEPVVIDDLLCIKANFHKQNFNVKHTIYITPKMSFGTGHHQTTRLVSKAMFDLNFVDKRVLDMGCGTAVLAILAEKLGANEILGIDIDDWSIENSIENCNENNCKNITIKKGNVKDLERELNFDIILANINKNVLKAQLPSYSAKLNKAGKLLLSGFFKTDTKELTELAAELQFKFERELNDDEWCMLQFERL